jgi:hypothetical protein
MAKSQYRRRRRGIILLDKASTVQWGCGDVRVGGTKFRV